MTANTTAPAQVVLALDNQERVAALERDVQALEGLWSKEFIVNAPNNEVVAGRRAVLDNLRGLGSHQLFQVRSPH